MGKGERGPCFLCKTHLKIFETYYPKTITNWYIDDWIDQVYRPYYKQFNNIHIKNTGGIARYIINNNIKKNLKNIVSNDKKKIKKYISNIIN